MKEWSVKERTFSSYFVTPMLDKPYSWLKNAGVVNVFIGDERHPEYDNHIFLLVQPRSNHLYGLLSNTESFKTFVTRYQSDAIYEMFVYVVPDKYQVQYDLLVNSDYTYYSKLGDVYIEKTLACHECDTTSKIYKIMTKHEDIYKEWEQGINEGLPRENHITIPREMEATRRFNMNVEVYRKYMMQ